MAIYIKYLQTALLIIGLSVLASVFLVIVAIPVIKGLDSYVIMSKSMEPALSCGDIIEVEKIAVNDIAPGNIITVSSGDAKTTFTHRVLYIDTVNGLIYTKGDANSTQDLYPVKYDKVLGRVVYKVPYAGKLVLSFREGTDE